MAKEFESEPRNNSIEERRRNLGKRSLMPPLDLTETVGLGTLNTYEMPDGTIYHIDAAPIPK